MINYKPALIVSVFMLIPITFISCMIYDLCYNERNYPPCAYIHIPKTTVEVEQFEVIMPGGNNCFAQEFYKISYWAVSAGEFHSNPYTIDKINKCVSSPIKYSHLFEKRVVCPNGLMSYILNKKD